MQKLVSKYVFMALAISSMISSAACTEMYYPMQDPQPRVSAPNANGETGPLAANEQIGGHLVLAMDTIDRSRLSHALDSPIGKPTTWTNKQSGTTYTVTPTEKVVLNENPYCRRYTVVTIRGSRTKTTTGTACVGNDSSWRSVRGGVE